jgi:hypothetical protein
MVEKKTAISEEAKHLAARAVMAYRASFPIHHVSLSSPNGKETGIVCDWKQVRSTGGVDDDTLLRRGFAFVYIGTIMDQGVSQEVSEDLRKELAADMSDAIEARRTAVDWGLVSSVNDTNPFAHSGYKLASRLLRADHGLVEELATVLDAERYIDGTGLVLWLDERAEALNLEELEKFITY